jgi:hypothetical protein
MRKSACHPAAAERELGGVRSELAIDSVRPQLSHHLIPVPLFWGIVACRFFQDQRQFLEFPYLRFRPTLS